MSRLPVFKRYYAAAITDHHSRIFARFDRALTLLERWLGADLRVQELAAAHGTSLHAFSMAFERGIGISFKAYLNRRPNQEACSLLLNTDWRRSRASWPLPKNSTSAAFFPR